MERLSGVPELLDGPIADFGSLLESLRDLARVNRWLGGVGLSRRALISLANGRHHGPRGRRVDWRSRPLRLLDVGTGGADLPIALLRWTSRRGILLEIEAIDARDEVIEAARRLRGEPDGLHLAVADGRELPYPDGSFDVAHTSLVAHHLEPDELLGLLREMDRVSVVGVIVNDLQRSRAAWIAAWLLGRLFTRNRVTRHDGPLSVRRAYRAPELAQIAAEAGLVEAARFRGFLRHRYALCFVRASASRGDSNARP